MSHGPTRHSDTRLHPPRHRAGRDGIAAAHVRLAHGPTLGDLIRRLPRRTYSGTGSSGPSAPPVARTRPSRRLPSAAPRVAVRVLTTTLQIRQYQLARRAAGLRTTGYHQSRDLGPPPHVQTHRRPLQGWLDTVPGFPRPAARESSPPVSFFERPRIPRRSGTPNQARPKVAGHPRPRLLLRLAQERASSASPGIEIDRRPAAFIQGSRQPARRRSGGDGFST